jgi:N-acetylmuramoyl-L-alanine amidase
MKSGRSRIAAFLAGAILLCVTVPAYPSHTGEAGREYALACQRLAAFKKSPKKKKYRSAWMECIRSFERVQKTHPKSPSAANACFDRAELYYDLYRYNKSSKDLAASLRLNGRCQAGYPRHARAPEALYRVVERSRRLRGRTLAARSYIKLIKTYPHSVWAAKAGALVKDRVSRGGMRRHDRKAGTTTARTAVGRGNGSAASGVKGIRYWSGGEYTRIVIDEDDPIQFRVHELAQPDRLVFDLLNSRLDASVDRDPLPVNDGVLKQVRARQHAPDIVRVVLDLASIKSYAAFPLHDPERLVIDVNGTGSPEPSPVAAVSGPSGTAESPAGKKYGLAQAPSTEAGGPVALPSKLPDLSASGGEKLTLSRQLGLKIRTIAIDAGHGGQDPGAIGKGGLKEKTVTLDIAKRLAALVKERMGCNVVMTRDRDVFIPLEDRPAIAKTRGADLFVSIHVNANRRRKARGIETYVQSLRASDREAMATAARENAMSTKKLSELKSELDRIFADLTREDKIEESLYLADSVQGSLVGVLRPVNRHAADLRTRIRRAFFYVLINTEMPSILAEVGFISNPEEERLLRTGEYRQKIAEALYLGVKKFIDARTPRIARR